MSVGPLRQDTFSGAALWTPSGGADTTGFAWKDGTTILRYGWGGNAGPVNNPVPIVADANYIYMPVNASAGSPLLRMNRTTRAVDGPWLPGTGWSAPGQTGICLSKDGKSIYLAAIGQIWSAPIAGGTFVKIASNPTLGAFSGAAGHGMCLDANGLLYVPAANGGQTQFAIFKVNPLTGSVTQLSSITGGAFDALTSDGTFIYYLNTWGGSAYNNIGQIKNDGTGQTAVWGSPGGANNFAQGCLDYEPSTTRLYFVNGAGTILQWTSTPTPSAGINNTLTALGNVPSSICHLP